MSSAGRALPLARPVRSVPQDVVYGLARIDASGRICERAISTALGRAGGDRLTLTADAGVVTAHRDPGGMVTRPEPESRPYGAAIRDRQAWVVVDQGQVIGFVVLIAGLVTCC